MAGVDIYDVVAGGNRTRLTKAQVTGLLEAGQLNRNDPCKPVEAKVWRTIDELLPLLKQEDSTHSLYRPTDLHRSRGRVFALATAASLLVVSAGSLAGYFALRSGAPGSKNAITPAVAVNPRPAVTYTIENPYFSSQKARAEEERLSAAQKIREQALAVKLAQERVDAERKEHELQKAVADARSPIKKGSPAAKRPKP
jgi:hypothetical protein